MPSYDFVQNPIVPDLYQTPMNGMNYGQQQQVYNQHVQYQQQMPKAEMPVEDNVVTGGFSFTVKPDNEDDVIPKNDPLTLPSPVPTDMNSKKHSSKPEVIPISGAEIVRAGDAPDSTINTYTQTTMLLNNTLDQLDLVASEIKEEMDQVRTSRTLKRKYDYMIGLSNNLCQLLGNKTMVLREINNAISKSNELDYRREKDRSATETSANDDKYIMDLYNSFIKNPNGSSTAMLGPSPIQTNIIDGSSIVRAPITGNGTGIPVQGANVGRDDAGYLNYLSNVSPEQNTMFYENDPNVKTVVVFDASTGNKFFQVMNVATGQVVPNVSVLDNRFMEDTTLDLKTNIAKNNNLHQTYPIITINQGITKEY
jgi:hypothetical protein